MDWTPIICAALASTGLFSVIQTIIQAKLDKKNKSNSEERLNSELLIAIAQERIYWLGRKYIERGYIEYDEYHCLDCIYQPYKDKGGNGMGKATMEALEQLVEHGHVSYETRKRVPADK